MNRITFSLAAVSLCVSSFVAVAPAQEQGAQKLEDVNYLLPAPPTLPRGYCDAPLRFVPH